MNNNTLKVDGQITVTILATNKTQDKKFKDNIEEIKKRCESLKTEIKPQQSILQNYYNR